MLKALIFDMDGVLIDSMRYVWDSFNEILHKQGIRFTDEDISRFMGRSLRDQMKIWVDEYGFEGYDFESFSREAGEIELRRMEEELPHDEALIRFLDDARAHGLMLAVATSSMKWRAERILDLLGIRDRFSAIVTADDVENHKPDPDVFLKAADHLGVDPADCVVFEDAANGIMAAKNAGMKAIGIRTPYHSEGELQHADHLINDFSDVSIDRIEYLF